VVDENKLEKGAKETTLPVSSTEQLSKTLVPGGNDLVMVKPFPSNLGKWVTSEETSLELPHDDFSGCFK
jgi:hypothetical protein